MSIKKAASITSEPHKKNELKAGQQSKLFHQFFTVYFTAIFLFFVIALSSVLWYLSLQFQQKQVLINEHITPLKNLLLQQSALLNTNKIVDKILHNLNAHQLVTTQKKLTLQSKKLSLLDSSHQSSYQQWFVKNDAASSLVAQIEINHTGNDQLNNKTLIQLDTLVDAIDIQLEKGDVNAKALELLSTVKERLMNVVMMLKSLSLQTSLADFEILSRNVDDMLLADYSKQLANQQRNRQGISDIVRDFIHLEDIILKGDLLANWHGNLTLMHDYKLQLFSQQEQVHSILASLSGSHQEMGNVTAIDEIANTTIFQLPIWTLILFAGAISFFSALLWLMRIRLKALSQFSVDCIDQALGANSTSLLVNEQHHKPDGYTAELAQIVDKIRRINNDHCGTIEYLALVEKNQQLEDKALNGIVKQEQLLHEQELVALNSSQRVQAQLLVDQQHYQEIELAAIRQLVLIGSSALTASIDDYNPGSPENYLFSMHQQGQVLVEKAKQARCSRYIQSTDSLLVLSDISLIAQIEEILLNLSNRAPLSENKVSLSIDDKILTEVNVDAELFTELFSLFIRLLLGPHKGNLLAVNLQLSDKNKGQQKICFTGEVIGADKIAQLPEVLHNLNDESAVNSAIGDYFITLLQYLHGNDVSAKLTEKGYQLTFTLPLAVTDNQHCQNFPTQIFPLHLADIDKVSMQLNTKYFKMPVEVLLAVKDPKQYLRLQKLLRGMGLQVTFVSAEVMLDKQWQSGRFAVLITEIAYQPFAIAMLEEPNLIRGVFYLGSSVDLTQKTAEYSQWISGGLTADIAVSELITAMLPWIRTHKVSCDNTTKIMTGSDVSHGESQNETITVAPTKVLQSFNFQRYLKNQGSAELALYMLEEYTLENTDLVASLNQAMAMNHVDNANSAVKALLVNGKILAAENLVHLCQDWQKLLINQELDNSKQSQISLLKRTENAVEAISLHATTVI